MFCQVTIRLPSVLQHMDYDIQTYILEETDNMSPDASLSICHDDIYHLEYLQSHPGSMPERWMLP